MSEMKMREVIESGFRVTVPDETSFRFCECCAYKSLSGLCLKEMDVGWWDTGKGKLVFLELKGREIWRDFDSSKDSAQGHLAKSLRGKLTDTLLMLAAVWIGTRIGKELKACLPAHVHQYPNDGNLKFVFLIDTPASRKPMLSPVKDAINKELAGRVRLFGVRHVTVVDLETAREIPLPVQKQA